MDIDYNGLFGLGEDGQEVADPAQAAEHTGENEAGSSAAEAAGNAGPGEPAGEEETEGGGTDSPGNSESPPARDSAQAKPEQTKEERARFAAARRQAEKDAAVEAARRDEREKVNALIKELGITDTEGGKPLETVEQLAQYARLLEARRLSEGLRDGTLDGDALERFVASAVERRLSAVQAPPAVERTTAEAQAQKAAVAAQLAEIGKLDPAITSMDDLMKLPTAKTFGDYVRKGLSFVDAFYLTNKDRLAESAAAKAATAAAQKTLACPGRSSRTASFSICGKSRPGSSPPTTALGKNSALPCTATPSRAIPALPTRARDST